MELAINALLLLAPLALMAIALAPILRGFFGWPKKRYGPRNNWGDDGRTIA